MISLWYHFPSRNDITAISLSLRKWYHCDITFPLKMISLWYHFSSESDITAISLFLPKWYGSDITFLPKMELLWNHCSSQSDIDVISLSSKNDIIAISFVFCKKMIFCPKSQSPNWSYQLRSHTKNRQIIFRFKINTKC